MIKCKRANVNESGGTALFVMQLIGLAFIVCDTAPIGVQFFFVINAAAAHDRRRALLTALIVAFCDVAFAFFCFFGAGAEI